MRSSIAAMLVLALASAVQAQDAVKIGAVIDKLKFTDIRALPRSLDDFGKKKAYVFVFTNTSCPVVKRYLPNVVLPWFEEFIAPWRMVRFRKYYRRHMTYWGAVISNEQGQNLSEQTTGDRLQSV